MQEEGYLDLVRRIATHGEEREGRNGKTFGMFGGRLEFDLAKGFPLLTTKKMFWRGIAEELLWFLHGSTDANELKEKGVHIWDGNTSRSFLDSCGLKDYPEGECGPIYGYQWRCFGGDYPLHTNGMDQLRYILHELHTNPYGRRAIICAWNPKQMHQMCLPPCHVLYNFHVSNRGLSCQLYCRSQDIMLGTPYNIASTSLLTHIIGKVLHMQLDRVILVTGDTHIYAEHLDGANEQINRTPFSFPSLKITKDAPPLESSIETKLKWIEELTIQDFVIENYESHGVIRMPMVA